MGACSSSGGVFNNYALVQGADKFLPVDIHVPGCPPRPEALLHGVLKLQAKIKGDPTLGWRERYRAEGTEELGDEQYRYSIAVDWLWLDEMAVRAGLPPVTRLLDDRRV